MYFLSDELTPLLTEAIDVEGEMATASRLVLWERLDDEIRQGSIYTFSIELLHAATLCLDRLRKSISASLHGVELGTEQKEGITQGIFEGFKSSMRLLLEDAGKYCFGKSADRFFAQYGQYAASEASYGERFEGLCETEDRDIQLANINEICETEDRIEEVIDVMFNLITSDWPIFTTRALNPTAAAAEVLRRLGNKPEYQSQIIERCNHIIRAWVGDEPEYEPMSIQRAIEILGGIPCEQSRNILLRNMFYFDYEESEMFHVNNDGDLVQNKVFGEGKPIEEQCAPVSYALLQQGEEVIVPIVKTCLPKHYDAYQRVVELEGRSQNSWSYGLACAELGLVLHYLDHPEALNFFRQVANDIGFEVDEFGYLDALQEVTIHVLAERGSEEDIRTLGQLMLVDSENKPGCLILQAFMRYRRPECLPYLFVRANLDESDLYIQDVFDHSLDVQHPMMTEFLLSELRRRDSADVKYDIQSTLIMTQTGLPDLEAEYYDNPYAQCYRLTELARVGSEEDLKFVANNLHRDLSLEDGGDLESFFIDAYERTNPHEQANDWVTKCTAGLALSNLGTPRAWRILTRDLLEEGIAEDDYEWKYTLLFKVISRQTSPEFLDLFITHFDVLRASLDSNSRAAWECIKNCGGERAISFALERLGQEEDLEEQTLIVEVLGEIGDAGTADEIERIMFPWAPIQYVWRLRQVLKKLRASESEISET